MALGAIAKLFLRELGIEVLSHVLARGRRAINAADHATWEQIRALNRSEEVLLNCVDGEAEQRMKSAVDRATEERDTVGGVFEVVAHGVMPGLGTYANWDERLDGNWPRR